ncbi:MAG: mannosyl-3-phosphoglycerate phosphatase [Kangiellaceae bacterium]|jgi:mannosyl-3-phosphoglycerate phosphatase
MSPELTHNKQILVFTDFDGSLLDHYTYSFEAAKPCLKRLSDLGIPIIPNTSKTLAEVSFLQKKMDLSTPLIVENGAAIYIPKQFLPRKPRGAVWKDGYWIKSFAQKRQYWQGIVKKIQAEHVGQLETFGNMGIERISEVTGLDAKSALLASQRQFGEPILWLGSNEQRSRFIEKAIKLGAFPLLGGRFMHICGDSNKGKALLWLLKEYKRQHPTQEVSSVAIGDSKNDIDMLEVADTAIRIASPVHSPPELERTHKVYTSVATGPQGWCEVMDQLIPDI